KMARIVDNDGARLRGDRRPLRGNGSTGTKETDVDPLKRRSAHRLNLEESPAKGKSSSSRPRRSEQPQFLKGELALFEDGNQLLADGTGGSENGETRHGWWFPF